MNGNSDANSDDIKRAELSYHAGPKTRGPLYGSLNLKVVVVSLNAISDCRVVAKVGL